MYARKLTLKSILSTVTKDNIPLFAIFYLHISPKIAAKCVENVFSVVIPVLLIELQHHVVRGDAQRPSTLVVLLPVHLIHVRRRHRAVVGVVVGVDGAAVVPCDVELDF